MGIWDMRRSAVTLYASALPLSLPRAPAKIDYSSTHETQTNPKPKHRKRALSVSVSLNCGTEGSERADFRDQGCAAVGMDGMAAMWGPPPPPPPPPPSPSRPGQPCLLLLLLLLSVLWSSGVIRPPSHKCINKGGPRGWRGRVLSSPGWRCP